MRRLNELNILSSYDKGEHDIATEFYMPCMNCSMNYDRAVGFFSSSIYMISWPSLKDFILRGGKMRIICSPILSKIDVTAIEEGYELRRLKDQDELLEDIANVFNDPVLKKPAQVLASLVSIGAVEFKIAFVKNLSEPKHKRIFHDKVGVFKDSFDNMVAFKGSMNETWLGLSADGNLETVDAYATWFEGREKQRVLSSVEYFEKMWNNEYSSAIVEEFPDVAKEKFVNAAKGQEWEHLVDEIVEEINSRVMLTAEPWIGGRTPKEHQANALNAWFKQGRRGVLEHATGSGKTFTALCAIRDSLGRKEIPIILVPSDLLLIQWYKELRQTFRDLDIHILLCGGSNNRWKNGLLRPWTKPGNKLRIVVAMMQTASRGDFLQSIYQGEHLFMVVDELHRIGSVQNRRIMELNSGPRLGLSATPRRAGDPEGTNAIFDYFGNIIPPPFTLQDAIKANALTPYMYYVHRVSLNPDEQIQWDKVTTTIQQLFARNESKDTKDPAINSRIKQLLIQRAKIIKSAENKVDLARNVVVQNYSRGQRWIVYCDDRWQLQKVLNELRNNNIDALEYHSAMTGNREQTLSYFEINGGVLVSIKCLDEGVDIPSVSHALILASSKNPREFIQRRGRVLRKVDGKSLAFIHDVITTPNIIEQKDPMNTSVLRGEIARSIEFGQGAENPSAIYELKRILLDLDIDYNKFLDEGFEEENEY